MRKYISYIIYAVAAVFMTGCMDVAVNPIEPESPTKVILQLTNADLVATRAVTVTDDDNFNEDLIKSVQCFFTVTGGDAVVYATDLIEVNQQATKTLEIEIPADKISTMFGTTNSCDVYVLANYGTKLEETTVTAVKEKEIALGTGATQDSFVMDGEAALTLNGVSISGTVSLERAAAKVVVKVNLKNSVTEGGVVWTSAPAGVKMAYKNSVNGSKISALAADAAETVADYSQEPTETSGIFTQDTDNSTETTYVGYQTTPFYSFPVSAEANDGVIELVIPWTPADGDPVEYKYQIPIDAAFERNHVYVVEVNVGMLGTLDGAVLTPSYVVVDWTENAINTSLSRPQYLVVDQTYVVMNNVEEYSVGYAASDEVTVTLTSNSIGSTYSSSDGEYDAVFGDVEVSKAGGNIILSHSLDNTRTATTGDPATRYDYKAQTFIVKVTLNSNPQIFEEITFVQYPAMYVTSYALTSSTVFVNGNTSGGNGEWWWVRGEASASANHYTVTVSSFDESTDEYLICDPRQPSNNDTFVFYANDNNNASVRTTFTDASGDNTLTGYRGSITGDAAENLVAPQFMFASSYISNSGGDQSLYVDRSAKYRCAAYQEYGYPAGRWRIPTPGELNVIGKLCAEGKIESIFVNRATYMSSNGPYTFNSTNGTFTKSSSTTSGTMRCVYDTWYWTDKCKDVSQFIWGAEGDIANGAKSNYLVSVE